MMQSSSAMQKMQPLQRYQKAGAAATYNQANTAAAVENLLASQEYNNTEPRT
ncbi:MAG: hypothetical protein MZV64_50360 [Ignavibacteriales bacterium]|nr:hypothetical protein [Ignavibacteriales bacterium]